MKNNQVIQTKSNRMFLKNNNKLKKYADSFSNSNSSLSKEKEELKNKIEALNKVWIRINPRSHN